MPLPPPFAGTSSWARTILIAALVVQAALAAWHLGRTVITNTAFGWSQRLFATDDDRVRAVLGEDFAVYELIRTHVPRDEWLLVEQPGDLRVGANGVGVEGGTPGDLAWLATVHQLRNLLFPAPFVPKAMTNAAAAVESVVGAGRSAWLLGPGAGLASRTPPPSRPGWTLTAENARCQLWRFTKG